MAQTNTNTSTKTYTRMLFLQKQIREILLETTQTSNYTLDRLLEAVEKNWICEIDVYAFNNINLCQARLKIEIDWSEYNRQMDTGKITIAVDTHWKNDLLPQTNASIWAFNAYIARYNLRTELRISYTQWVYNNPSKQAEVAQFLNATSAEPIKWAGTTIDDYAKNRDFPEFGLGLYFVE